MNELATLLTVSLTSIGFL